MKKQTVKQFLKYAQKQASKKGKKPSPGKSPKSPHIENMKFIADDFFKSADDFLKKYKRKDID